MAGRGGARKGAGRKPKADEEKVNAIFLSALGEMYNKDSDEESKVAFAKDLLESERGKLFIAEHLFGKPKDNLKLTHEMPKPLRKHFTDFEPEGN